MVKKILKLFHRHNFEPWLLYGSKYDADGVWFERKCKKCGKIEQKSEFE